MVWLAEQAFKGKAGENFWWIGPIYPQAKIAYRRLSRGLPRSVYTSNATELTLTLPNDATIWFKGADKPDSLYGEDVHAAVIDEASRCKEEAWHAVRSTLTATRGKLRVIGNVKGRVNWAYNLARRAEAGEPDMHYAKITAADAVKAGIITASEVEDARRLLPENVFRELYEAEPSDDGGNPFGLKHIRQCIGPVTDTRPRVWGIDLAKSVDWTVAIALDDAGHVCRYERWQGPWEETFRQIRRLCDGTMTLIDSTGVGDPLVERLTREGGSTYQGYHFTPRSKQQLMEGLAVAIQQHEITYPDGPIVHELETFEYEYTRTGVRYSAAEGLHDDCVCSLALAVMHWRMARPVAYASAPAAERWQPGQRLAGWR